MVLGADQGPCGRSWERIRARSGPGSSGKAIWGPDQAEKWPKPEREGDLGKEPGPLSFSIRRSTLRIFSIDGQPGMSRIIKFDEKHLVGLEDLAKHSKT